MAFFFFFFLKLGGNREDFAWSCSASLDLGADTTVQAPEQGGDAPRAGKGLLPRGTLVWSKSRDALGELMLLQIPKSSGFFISNAASEPSSMPQAPILPSFNSSLMRASPLGAALGCSSD